MAELFECDGIAGVAGVGHVDAGIGGGGIAGGAARGSSSGGGGHGDGVVGIDGRGLLR